MPTIEQLLAQAIQTTNQSSAMAAGLSDQLGQDAARVAELGRSGVAAGAEAVAQAQQAAGIKAAADYATRELHQKAQVIAGFDPAVAENELQKSFNALNAAQTENQAAMQQYRQTTEASFFDNPLGFIVGQLNLPQITARVNNSARMAAAAQENISTRTTMLSDYNRATAANVAGQLKDAALLQAEAEARLGFAKLQEQESQNISRVAGINMQRIQAANIIHDNQLKNISMQLQAAQTAAAREQTAVMLEERRQILRERRDALAAKEDGKAELNARYAQAAKFFGVEFAPTVDTIGKLPKATQDVFNSFAISGQLGGNLFESMQNLTKMPAADRIKLTNPGAGVMIDGLKTGAAQFIDATQREYANPKYQGPKPKAGQTTVEGIESYQEAIVQSGSLPNAPRPLSSDAWDKTFNPYKADHKLMVQAITGGELSQLAGNKMFQAIQTVQSAKRPGEQFTVDDEQRALMILRDQVASKKLQPQEFGEQIATYYRTAGKKNLQHFQYTVAGIPVPDRYPYQLKSTGTFGKVIPTDLYNPTQLTHAVMQDVRGITAATQSGIGSMMLDLATGTDAATRAAMIAKDKAPK